MMIPDSTLIRCEGRRSIFTGHRVSLARAHCCIGEFSSIALLVNIITNKKRCCTQLISPILNCDCETDTIIGLISRDLIKVCWWYSWYCTWRHMIWIIICKVHIWNFNWYSTKIKCACSSHVNGNKIFIYRKFTAKFTSCHQLVLLNNDFWSYFINTR
jgi:hypothetical protein